MRNNPMLTSALATVAARAFANETPAAPKAKGERIDPVLTGTFKVELPQRTSKRGSESKYDFAALTEVGMAFGVKNKTAAQLSSIVSNANRKAATVKTDENGNTVFKMKTITAQDGTKTSVPTDKPEMIDGVRYYAVDVDADYAKKIKGTPLEGSKAIVVREK